MMTGDSGVFNNPRAVPRELVPPPRGPIGRFLLVWWLIRGQQNSLPRHRYLSDVARCTLIRDSGWSRRKLSVWFLRDLAVSIRSLPATMPIIFILTLAALALLPLSYGPSIWPSDESATAFLSVLWQVMAGTLGIVVAAVLFLYEAYGSTIKGRYGITLVEYSSGSGVSRLVGWLIASLALTGLVLLGWGDGAPRGWAGFLALAVSAWALGSLPRAFNSIAKLVGTSEIHEMRRKYLRPRIAQAVRDDLLAFRMRGELEKYLTSAGLEPAVILNRDQRHLIVAARSGIVTDVDLRKLTPVLQRFTGAQIYIPLSYKVRKGSIIAVAIAEQGGELARQSPEIEPEGANVAEQVAESIDPEAIDLATESIGRAVKAIDEAVKATGQGADGAGRDTEATGQGADAAGHGTEIATQPARRLRRWRWPSNLRWRRGSDLQRGGAPAQQGDESVEHGTEAALQTAGSAKTQQEAGAAEQISNTIGPVEAEFLVMSTASSTTRVDDVAYLKELHLDALRAIRDKDKVQVDLNIALYEELVRELLNLDQHLTARGLMSPVSDTNLLSSLRNQLFIQFHECIQVRNEDAARSISWATLSIMHDAVDAGHLQVARDFLKLTGMMAISEVNLK